MTTKRKNMVEFGDYIFIEEQPDVVTKAELFKTLPVKYEHLRKTHRVLGRGDKLGVLVGGSMDARYTIVLERKDAKTTLVAGVQASDCSSLRRSVLGSVND